MLTYLFHTTICWALFALLYVLLLRRETFFQANRLYLLLALAAGLLLPAMERLLSVLLPLPGGFSIALPALTIGLQQAEKSVGNWVVLPYLWWGYAAGATVAGARMLWGVVVLCRMAATGNRERLPDGTLLVRTSHVAMPCSFFHWIFVPEHLAGGADFDKMLVHEQAHVRGGHSADVLLLELLCVAFWFHPIAHWYRRSLRTVHEFLADAEASRRTDRRQYGLLLLRQAHPLQALSCANHFFQAPLQQRLLMLTRQTSPTMRCWKYGMTLPILAFLVIYFQKNTRGSTGHAAESRPVYASKQLEKQPAFPGGMPALMEYLSKTIQYPAAARQGKIEGMVLVQFSLDETGTVRQAAAILSKETNPPPEYSEMAAEAVRVIRQMPPWEPAEIAGRSVSCQLSLPIRFKLE